jgi:hypothetical protein
MQGRLWGVISQNGTSGSCATASAIKLRFYSGDWASSVSGSLSGHLGGANDRREGKSERCELHPSGPATLGSDSSQTRIRRFERALDFEDDVPRGRRLRCILPKRWAALLRQPVSSTFQWRSDRPPVCPAPLRGNGFRIRFRGTRSPFLSPPICPDRHHPGIAIAISPDR